MGQADRIGPSGAPVRCRFDKWLWAARFYKTRSLAAAAIENGHARFNKERVKPAQAVGLGARVQVKRQGLTWDVEVTGVSDRRGSAADAAQLYRETPESVAEREQAIAQRKAAAAETRHTGRPTKRDRRKLEDFLNEP
ncbi:MAG TPA: S4 domain-containing protein [Casimicrobiaceae bacterium]|nr:S4 domain-containing protein [Casimicrobiaceae bacterium]